jgi:hypothetical protein
MKINATSVQISYIWVDYCCSLTLVGGYLGENVGVLGTGVGAFVS